MAQACDRSEPVLEYLGQLEREAVHRRPKRCEEALAKLADIQFLLERFVLRNDLEEGRQIKYLQEGIWEFKTADSRLYFYPFDEHPMVRAVRLTNGFPRDAPGRHATKHLNYAKKIRREDAGHDNFV
jgi:hypothetical protein